MLNCFYIFLQVEIDDSVLETSEIKIEDDEISLSEDELKKGKNIYFILHF